jgi:aspartate kinase
VASARRGDAAARSGRAPIVLKFGGTSVADAAGFERVATIVRAHGGPRPVVVVSALARVTDALFGCAAAAAAGDPGRARADVTDLLERHAAIARRLLEPERARGYAAELEQARQELGRLCDELARAPGVGGAGGAGGAAAGLGDAFVSYGERLAASLLAATLERAGLPARYVDARRCILTDDAHGRAAPLFADTERCTRGELLPLVDAGSVPVLGGYIAATRDGVTTTLGRGGSDYTAALVGAAIGAEEIQIWTDVSGVLTADPRIVPAARPVARLSYAEAAELAYFGAKVLHPKTIQPAMDRGIPVRICNSHAPDDPGTIVTARPAEPAGTVKAIAHKTGLTVLQVSSTRMLGAYGFLRALFEVFDRHRTAVDVVTTSEVSVSLTLDDTRALPAVVADLGGLGEVTVEPGRAIICVVGEGLRTTPGIAARVFTTVRDINVSLISQGASRVNLTFVVEEARVREAVERLHAAFFEAERTRPGAEATRSATT